VFISYARRDYDKVRRVVDQLAALGISYWLDQYSVEGGDNYALDIARGIRLSRVFILMCSDASLRSRNVNQEIMLAWKYARPYLPLLLEAVDFPEQLQYFLEGSQWIELCDRPVGEWLPRVHRALTKAGVASIAPAQSSSAGASSPALADDSGLRPAQRRADLDGLRSLASFTDRIWPLAATARADPARQSRPTFRGLGAPQQGAQHGHKIGSRLELAVQAERAGHLLLLDEGPEGIVYCLCPSWFAPDTRIREGINYLPQPGMRYESFQVSGQPGREQLLAIITDEPLAFDWMTADPSIPARTLGTQDIELLLTRLRQLDPGSWAALATYFDITR
jgi:hypothetical protein